MTQIIDGKKLSKKIRRQIGKEVQQLKEQGTHPLLATVLVGDDPASETYVQMKTRACEKLGIQCKNLHLSEDVEEKEIIHLIHELNQDGSVNGILVQLPLAEHLNTEKILSSIKKEKDVDGLTPENMGKLMHGIEDLVSCTPKGIIRMLEEHDVELIGKEVVVVSHSILVGKPLSMLLLNRNATVRVCHVHTRDLEKHTKEADIVIVAAGVPNLLKKHMVSEGVIVIDVGTNKVDDQLVGDVDFEEVKEKTSLITPVPGGVGPMTISMLLENTIKAARKQSE